MKMPRDLSGKELVKFLSEEFGYSVANREGSHVKMSRSGQSVTIPLHDPLKTGMLDAILLDVARIHGTTKKQILVVLLNWR